MVSFVYTPYSILPPLRCAAAGDDDGGAGGVQRYSVDAHIAALALQSGINVGADTGAMAGALPSEDQFNAHVLGLVRKESALPSIGEEYPKGSTLDVRWG
jgi:hypothetical protein